MRILNPYFIQEAAFQFIGLPLNNGLMGKGVSDTRTETRSSLMKILNWEECPEKKNMYDAMFAENGMSSVTWIQVDKIQLGLQSARKHICRHAFTHSVQNA